MAFKPVVFNEGEPLDPQKLNDLNTNIKASFDASDNLFNQTKDNVTTSLKPVFYAGNLEAIDLSPNSPKSFPIDLGTGFDFEGNPIYITATPRGIVRANENINITIYRGMDNPRIYVQTNSKERRTMTIDWIAVQFKEV